MISETFIETVGHYSRDHKETLSLWSEIEEKYTSSSRHYHNLGHLEFLLRELTEVKSSLSDWHTIIFSIVYHDLIYNPLKRNNEEKSAAVASRRLQKINFPTVKIQLCSEIILATKKHSVALDEDMNLFTDADLAILGKDEITYQKYTNAVRKEYSMYPDLLYKPGRRKVLNHFLGMEKIFKTTSFFERYENQARLNLQHELSELIS